MRQPDAVEDRPDLSGDPVAIDGAGPDRFARTPGRGNRPRPPVSQHDRHAVVTVLERDLVALVAEEDHPLTLEADEPGVAHLARDGALALVEEMVNRGRDGREPLSGL